MLIQLLWILQQLKIVRELLQNMKRFDLIRSV
nr:MAG TPA: hypothetical protein [Caudoviricetes sp.]